MAAEAGPQEVRKRDGSTVAFDDSKIERAIARAAGDVLADESRAAAVASRLTGIVVDRLRTEYRQRIPHIENIQDAVERVLMAEGYCHIAKSYILYREKRSEVRFAKSALGLKDDLKLPVNTMAVLRRRYLLKDDDRHITETPCALFRRVAHHVARAEVNYASGPAAAEVEERFYRMMRRREFLPNSPTLMNAGTPLGQLAACFVLPVADSITEIFEALASMARIHQTGGGTGFDFSHLRPRGDLVRSTKGRASGPVSFMSVFDKATEVIVQGGKRRGANMGVLRCDHPDVVDFVEAKTQRGAFENFNLSVGVTNGFMRAVRAGRSFALVSPRTGRKARTIDARALFDLIVNAAWRTGDPGLIFLDHVNRHNPTPELGRIEATNPCGEVPLLPNESCVLGSINLGRMVTDKERGKGASPATVDWDKLRETICSGVRFLDDVLETNKFPLEPIETATRGNRKIGLGVMGFADMLIRLGIPYDTDDAVKFASRLMRFVHEESLAASQALAEQRGVFPNFERSIHAPAGRSLRNATVNTIAPTGTISIIAGCSSGIEPLFAVSFVRNVLSGTRLFETHPLFETVARDRGFHSRDLLAEVARHRSLRDIRGIPNDVKRLFVTAFDVTPSQHLKIQAAFQKYTDNAVSKTINLPSDATVQEVRDIYLEAHRLKCKGITVYRYGSRSDQVLSISEPDEAHADSLHDFISADTDYSGGCIGAGCDF
ncbi:MAG: adenosylcobalamin-dependent ribonucleoside-diphosphate reductase [Sedimentisphaerales bacterium]|nr:adenosylcobalamin-dependent ribonucleoside-diphosphate reductase [Sedimentisphaerales bacterium]